MLHSTAIMAQNAMHNLSKLYATGVLLILAGCTSIPPAAVTNPLALPCIPEQLWLHSQAELKSRGFDLDIVDRRHGLIQTFPRTSSQWFEFWARDVVTDYARAEASVQSVRRSVRIEMHATADDQCTLACRVDVERLVAGRANVSGTVRANSVFSRLGGRMPTLSDRRNDRRGRQWVSLGRDQALEDDILRAIGAAMARQRRTRDRPITSGL